MSTEAISKALFSTGDIGCWSVKGLISTGAAFPLFLYNHKQRAKLHIEEGCYFRIKVGNPFRTRLHGILQSLHAHVAYIFRVWIKVQVI